MLLGRRVAIVALAIGVVAALVSTSPASAAPSQPKTTATQKDGSTVVFAPCIAQAVAEKANHWLCDSSGLSVIGTDSAGRSAVIAHTAIAPAIIQSAQTEAASASLTTGDDYDYWCETSGVCSRDISPYISETKGNATYGNANGVIGTFDVIIRTNLSYRTPNWKESLIWDGGPAVTFSELWIDCYENVDYWWDNNCGVFSPFSGGAYPVISGALGAWRWNSSTIYGNYLNNDSTYYALTNGRFYPSGYDQFLMESLSTDRYNCPHNSACTFPV